MTWGKKILLLAGTSEARRIAQALVARGVNLTVQMAEPPRGQAAEWDIPYVLRPFGTAADAAKLMAGCDAVLDASHGFDKASTGFAHMAARQLGLPCLSVQRLPWEVPKGAGWHRVPDIATAMPLIAPHARVFCTTGRGSLMEYADFPGAYLLVRQMEPASQPVPFQFVKVVPGDPPFSIADEVATFQALACDTLICRNTGGGASRTKLDAAHQLGMQVILIERPPLPQGVVPVDEVSKALEWVSAL